jgi:hypothetical protein
MVSLEVQTILNRYFLQYQLRTKANPTLAIRDSNRWNAAESSIRTWPIHTQAKFADHVITNVCRECTTDQIKEVYFHMQGDYPSTKLSASAIGGIALMAITLKSRTDERQELELIDRIYQQIR